MSYSFDCERLPDVPLSPVRTVHELLSLIDAGAVDYVELWTDYTEGNGASGFWLPLEASDVHCRFDGPGTHALVHAYLAPPDEDGDNLVYIGLAPLDIENNRQAAVAAAQEKASES